MAMKAVLIAGIVVTAFYAQATNETASKKHVANIKWTPAKEDALSPVDGPTPKPTATPPVATKGISERGVNTKPR